MKITNTETEKERIERTVLDQYQYPQYFPLQKNETIELWDTWKCLDRTAPNRDFCPNPNAQASTPVGLAY